MLESACPPKRASIVADLHCHSTASDGSWTPAELVSLASEHGYQALALTDHDTIDGLDEAVAAGRKWGLRVIPGIEVSLRFGCPQFVGSLHLLLYFPERYLSDVEFRAELRAVLGRGRGPQLVQARVEAINREFLRAAGWPRLETPLTFDEVMAEAQNEATRRHFALALKKAHGLTERADVSAIIGNDSPAYLPSGIEPTWLAPVLEAWPMVVIQAHPAAGSFPGESLYKEVLPPAETVEALLPEIHKAVGLHGLEVHYPGHTEMWRARLRDDWRARFGLTLVTGGSDAHDPNTRPFGTDGVDATELESLLQAIGRL